MNRIDFTQPNGFPLEADATLGFMQTAFREAINGLSQFAAAATGIYILSGCQELVFGGSTYGDGWVIWNGELLPFIGGSNATGKVFIDETKVAKQNQNGVLLDRYFTRRVRFGNGTTEAYFSDFSRLNGYHPLSVAVNRALTFEGTETVILAGGQYTNGNIEAGYAMIGNKTIVFPSYTGGVFPVYLTPLSTWTTSEPIFGEFITFSPTTTQQYEAVIRRRSAFIGEIRMMAANMADFDATGLGIATLTGWAIANGNNGTFDLRGRFTAGYFDMSSLGYETLGGQGGADSVTLTVDQMPRHNHTSNDNTLGNVDQGLSGLMYRSVAGQNTTSSTSDGNNSGVEPNIVATPQHIPPQGDNQPFDNRPPFTVVLYIQRIA